MIQVLSFLLLFCLFYFIHLFIYFCISKFIILFQMFMYSSEHEEFSAAPLALHAIRETEPQSVTCPWPNFESHLYSLRMRNLCPPKQQFKGTHVDFVLPVNCSVSD